MPYLIAHEDDCEILKIGPTTHILHQEYPDGSRTGTSIATLCTCGGVKVSVPLWTPSNTGIAELDFPPGAPD